MSIELGSKWLVAYALEGFVSLLSTIKKSSQALCLAGVCDELRRTAYIPLSPVERDLLDQTMKCARQSLYSQQSSDAQKQGRSMSLEEAVEYARREVAFD